MKKLALAILALSALATASIAAEPSKMVRLSIDLIQEDKAVSSMRMDAVEGLRSPYSNISVTSYASNCHLDAYHEAVLEMDKVTVGTTAVVTPTEITDDGATVNIALWHAELDSMTSVKANGCTYGIPNTHGFQNSMTVRVKSGQSVKVPAIAGSEGYSVMIRAL